MMSGFTDVVYFSKMIIYIIVICTIILLMCYISAYNCMDLANGWSRQSLKFVSLEAGAILDNMMHMQHLALNGKNIEIFSLENTILLYIKFISYLIYIYIYRLYNSINQNKTLQLFNSIIFTRSSSDFKVPSCVRHNSRTVFPILPHSASH
jgi:hypothetical protein